MFSDFWEGTKVTKVNFCVTKTEEDLLHYKNIHTLQAYKQALVFVFPKGFIKYPLLLFHFIEFEGVMLHKES